MAGISLGRRSSTNPVRISLLDREEKNAARTESKRIQVKSKISTSTADSSHIPRPRLRASSCDRATKTTGRTPLRHGPTTPRTPLASKSSAFLTVGSCNKIHSGLPIGRRSLSADRASSIGAKGPRKDIRPLTDKAYQTYMLNKIDNYFVVNHCSSMLNSNGSLKPITLKMFVEVSGYLLKTLDIKQLLTITNYVEELPKIAKKLHYPGIINKSWLKTANAMHSWANVLGWICWLVEICEVRQVAFEKYCLENLPFTGNEREATVNRNALFSMLNCYNAWNDEKLDEEASMVEKYLQEIEEQQGVHEEDLNNAHFALKEQMEKQQVADNDFNKLEEEVKHLQEVLSSLQKEEGRQLNDMHAKEESIKMINLETEQINVECNILCEQIRLQDAQRDELLATIKQQPICRAEKDKIMTKCSEIERYINRFDEHLQEIQKEVYTMDIKLATVNNNLTKAILMYNKDIFMHLSDNTDVDLEELKMPETGIVHPEMIEIINDKVNKMNNFKESLKAQVNQKERSLESNLNELENLQERMRILEEENNDLVGKIKEKKSLIRKIKMDAKNEETKLKEQIKNLKSNIENMQSLMPNVQETTAELEETADKLKAVRRRKAYIEESARLFFDKFYEILGEHRNELYNTLKKHNK